MIVTANKNKSKIGNINRMTNVISPDFILWFIIILYKTWR